MVGWSLTEKVFMYMDMSITKDCQNGKAYAEIKQYYLDKPAYNCGVDVTNYEPVTLDEMIRLKELNKDGPYIN